MKMYSRTHLACLFVAGLLSCSLAACGGSNQQAETAEAIEDANDSEAEAREKQHEDNLEAQEGAAEAREEHYDNVE